MSTTKKAAKSVTSAAQNTKPSMIVPAIMLTTWNSDAMEDYLFWTGFSIEQAINHAIREYMEVQGECDMWTNVNDPKKRAAAYKRAGYTAEQIANADAAIEAQIIKGREEDERELAKSRKEMARFERAEAKAKAKKKAA